MEDDIKGYCLYCFNVIMINNKWIKVDVRGNMKGKNVQFFIDIFILVFKNRFKYDEYFFDGIFVRLDILIMEMFRSVKIL